MNDDPTFSIHELAAEFRLTPATIRKYVQLGILPRPTRGPHARYPHVAWTRLAELRRAKDRHRTRAEWAEKFQSANSPSTNGTT